MKLGDKVKCYGYLKKVQQKYVLANMNHYEKSGNMLYKEEYLFLDEDGETTQTSNEIIECEFDAFVIGKKKVSMETWYGIVFDHNGNDLDAVQVLKGSYIDCIHVAFRMGGTRLVPIEKIEHQSQSRGEKR